MKRASAKTTARAAAPAPAIVDKGPAFTFSARARIANCPDSERLPHVRRPPSEDAARGTAIHRYLLLDVPRLGEKAALALVPPEHQKECAQLDAVALGLSNPAKWATEVAVAYNPETGEARELARSSAERDYSDVPGGVVAGTADAVGMAPGMVVVPDLKTGGSDLGPPGEAEQMAGYGTAFAALYGLQRARVGFLLVPPGRAPRFEWDELGPERLKREREKLLAEVRSVQSPSTGPLRLSEGAWCQYCPARDSCPAKARHVAALALGEPAALDIGRQGVRAAVHALSEADLALTLERVRDGRQLLEEVDLALRERAQQAPILLGNGRVWGPHTVLRDKVLDQHMLRAALEEMLGEAAAEVAAPLNYDYTKEKLKQALKLAGNASKENEARVLEALRANGLERVQQVRFESHKPGDD